MLYQKDFRYTCNHRYKWLIYSLNRYLLYSHRVLALGFEFLIQKLSVFDFWTKAYYSAPSRVVPAWGSFGLSLSLGTAEPLPVSAEPLELAAYFQGTPAVCRRLPGAAPIVSLFFSLADACDTRVLWLLVAVPVCLYFGVFTQFCCRCCHGILVFLCSSSISIWKFVATIF